MIIRKQYTPQYKKKLVRIFLKRRTKHQPLDPFFKKYDLP